MKIETEKKLAASLSAFSNAMIIILKLIAGLISGSMSIISEAIHSTSDFFASILTYFAVIRSVKPADKEHPFGHGRYEDMAGFIEGCLIVIAAFYIIFEAVKKIITSEITNFDSTLGIVVMAISVVANIFVSKYLFYVAKKSDSISLKADAKHLSADIYSSFGVIIGLILIKITGFYIFDSLIAIFVALIILKTGFTLTKDALNNLLDGSLPFEDVEKIEKILQKCDKIRGYKALKSRKSGSQRDIDITLLVDENMTIKLCHKVCDELEENIRIALGKALITIHCEPYENTETNSYSCQKSGF